MMIRIDVVLSASMEPVNPYPLDLSDLLDNKKYYDSKRLQFSTKSKHIVINTDHILYIDTNIDKSSAVYNHEVRLTKDAIDSDYTLDRIVMDNNSCFVVLPQVTKMIVDLMNNKTNYNKTTDGVGVLV